MAFNFPANPAVKDVYVFGGQSYTFNGYAWMLTDGGVAPPADYVDVSGDTMQGPLMLAGNPTTSLEAATKTYVDSMAINSGSGNVVGPAAGVHDHIVLFDGVTGKLIKDSGTAISALFPKTGGVVSGSVTANSFTSVAGYVGAGPIQLDAPANSGSRVINSNTAGLTRWSMLLADAAPETGGNAGANWDLIAYKDDGSNNGTALSFSRANLSATFGGNLTALGSGVFDGNLAGAGLSLQGSASINGFVTCLGVATFATGICKWDGAGNSYIQYLNNSGGLAGNIGWMQNILQMAAAPGVGTALQLDGGSSFLFTGGAGYAFKVGGGVWASTSDARIKTVEGSYTTGLDQVVRLNPVRYRFKGNDTTTLDEVKGAAPFKASMHYAAAKDVKTFVGLIAQEVEAVMPSMVHEKDGYIDGVATAIKHLDTNELIFALINSIKELKTQVDSLSTTVAALKQ